jgi:hypothetical protein
MEKLTAGQYIVLQHHLSGFPDDKSFKEILDMIDSYDDEVSIWEALEEWDRDDLVDHIAGIAQDIDKEIERAKNK